MKGKDPLPKICQTYSYNNETWHTYNVPKEDLKKCIKHMTRPLSSADISIFLPEIPDF